MVCGFSETESNFYRIWNPETRSVVESRNVVYIETPQNFLPTARRLSPQQDLELPPYGFSDNTHDDNYVSHDDMLWDVQNYTSTLDFGVDTLARTVELLLPQQASPGVTSPGGTSPATFSPGGVTPEESSLPPAQAPAPAPAPTSGPALTSVSAAPRAISGHANRGTVGVTPTITRSRAASLLFEPVTTRYDGGRNDNRATLAELFEAGTLQRLSELELGPLCFMEDIAHQAENARFNVEYTDAATNALGSFSGGENKEQIPNTFKEAMTLSQAARWKLASDRRSRVWKSMTCTRWYPSLQFRTDEKSSTPVEYTRSRQTENTGPTGRAGVVTSPRDRLRWDLYPRMHAPEHPGGTCNRRGAGLRDLHARRANSISQH